MQFAHRYRDRRDVETAAFIAATFAFGNVAQIHRFLDRLFAVLAPSPFAALAGPRTACFGRISGLSHRFISPSGVRRFLRCVREALATHGSLEELFRAGAGEAGGVRDGLCGFLGWFRRAWGAGLPRERNFLFPDPAKGSACKRHNLFLRWMVRGADGVDLGIWTALAPRDLVVPLDTHMARMARSMGLTSRRGADWIAALEVTAAFREVCPEDPTRFDFPLTRIGILRRCTPQRRGVCRACPIAGVCARAVPGDFDIAVPIPSG